MGVIVNRVFYACAMCISGLFQTRFISPGGRERMARFLHHRVWQVWRSAATPLLAFFLTSGFVAGVCLFRGLFSVSWMRSFLSDSVSIVNLILFTFLPFLITAYAVFLKMPGLIFPIAFIKGFLFSVSALHITLYFVEIGCLARYILLFSDVMSLPLLFFFWRRHISGIHTCSGVEILFYFSLVSLICSIDYCLISPLWAYFKTF